LLSAALAKLQARADQAAAALGKRSAALIEVSIHDSGPGLFYKSSMMAMDARAATMDIAAPVASPGKSEVQLNGSARALRSPGRGGPGRGTGWGNSATLRPRCCGQAR